MSGHFPIRIVTALLALFAALTTPGAVGDLHAQTRPTTIDTAASTAFQQSISVSRRSAIVVAAEQVAPAVVSVNVVRGSRPLTAYERMFLPPGYERQTAGMGSGFIIDASGLVLTNEHVVRGADQVLVTLADGREFDATIVGTDEMNDVALLQLTLPADTEALPIAPLGDSDNLMIGEWVVAIGNPLGFLLSNTEPSVTVGVVSAVGRHIIPSGSDQRGYYLDMIQTDAAINPGNSGGALVNALGRVVGINSSILSQSGGSQGLGFAIPINRARRIVQDLVEDGRVRRPWIGADVEPLETAGLHRTQDVRIARVVPGSPAAEVGLRPGMLIRAIGGERVATPLDWEAKLLEVRVGQPIRLTVDDGEGERTITVVPSDLPSVSAERIRALQDFEFVTLTQAIRAERGIASEAGALIVSLSPAAEQIGFRPGDVVLQINRMRVRSAEEAARALGVLGGRGVVVYFERNGQIGSTAFRVR
ncbi:MAG TPA: trypsin-like peptidase domain-containing protein [Longimicrobiaceae bacterium]|nr:trypsin-like peptidase domain-containing protein [Longimicrobiaceae bacterium]